MVSRPVPSVEVLLPSPSDWTVAQTKALRFMSEAQATKLMDEYELPDEARTGLWGFVGTHKGPETLAFPAPPSPPPTSSYRPHDPDRPLWLAAAWLCGASYSVLGAVHGGISEQAIQQSVNRSMPDVEERHTNRLGYRISRSRVDALRVLFYENVMELRHMSPVDVARWLIDHEKEQ